MFKFIFSYTRKDFVIENPEKEELPLKAEIATSPVSFSFFIRKMSQVIFICIIAEFAVYKNVLQKLLWQSARLLLFLLLL